MTNLRLQKSAEKGKARLQKNIDAINAAADAKIEKIKAVRNERIKPLQTEMAFFDMVLSEAEKLGKKEPVAAEAPSEPLDVPSFLKKAEA